jgi:hypothetical protein
MVWKERFSLPIPLHLCLQSSGESSQLGSCNEYRNFLFHRSLWTSNREGYQKRNGHLCGGDSDPRDLSFSTRDFLYTLWGYSGIYLYWLLHRTCGMLDPEKAFHRSTELMIVLRNFSNSVVKIVCLILFAMRFAPGSMRYN